MIYCLDDYKSYAEVCFREFGDRVKHWITFNESFSFCQGEYASGVFAPGRFSSWEQGNCSVGIQEQNLTLRAIINCLLTEKPSDCTKRNIRFMNPLIKGDYPLTLRKIVGNRLPKFSKEQSKLVKGAFDFIGLNYYTAYFAENVPPSNNLNFSYNTDPRANLTGARKGVPIGPTASKEPELAKLKEQA